MVRTDFRTIPNTAGIASGELECQIASVSKLGRTKIGVNPFTDLLEVLVPSSSTDDYSYDFDRGMPLCYAKFGTTSLELNTKLSVRI